MITSDTLKHLRMEIDAALADTAKRHNVTLKAGNASYNREGTEATFKLEVVALGEGGTPRDIPAELFISNAHMVGLKAEYLGKPVNIQGRTFTITGFKPKARKNCITVKDADGKTFVTDAATVKRQLAAK